jgi:hypothetical protein
MRAPEARPNPSLERVRAGLPGGWVISKRPVHEALVTEADFIAARHINAAAAPHHLRAVADRARQVREDAARS